MSEEYIGWLDDDWNTVLDQNQPIVRCRDCVAYEPYHTYAGMKLDYGECMKHRRQTNDGRFCSWGERKVDR